MVAWLPWAATPAGALVVATTGLLLGYVECNRPGRVVPGAAGLLLLLLGVHGLAAMPARAVGWGLLAGAAVVYSGMVWWRGLAPRGLGAVALEVGAMLLVVTGLVLLPARRGLLPWVVSVPCGVVAAGVTGWLARMAGLARRSKFGHGRASDEARQTGVRESWEPSAAARGRVD